MLPVFANSASTVADAVPFSVQMEVDHPVDDLLVVSEAGQRSYVQAKADRNTKRALLGALEQWISAVVQGGTQDDALVLCTAHSSTTLDDLNKALARSRDRYAQVLSAKEQAAFDAFTSEIINGSPEGDELRVRDEILRRCVIWHADGASDDSPAVVAACTMLGSVFGGYDKGRAAFALLRDKICSQAMLRSGLDINQARELLASAGLLPVRSIPASTRAALAMYRTAMRDRAAALVVPGLPLDVPSLPVPRLLDNLRVYCPSFVDRPYHTADAYKFVPLTVLARRVARLLLLGGPGVGKTTALVHLAAATIGHAGAPMPILVRLGKLADRLKNEREIQIADHVLIDAMDIPTLDAAAADLVRGEAIAQMRDGRALVMLDALDETGEIRHDVVRALKVWLDTVHDDLHVIVSSRDTAYASASVLGLTEAVLGPPFDLNETVVRVLLSAADWSGRPDLGDDAGVWLDKRLQWLNTAVGDFWEMMDIPLFAIHIAAVAAGSRINDLPSDNAHALRSVVESVWLQWEAGVRRQGPDALPGLPDRGSSADAFNSTFSLVTDQIDNDGARIESLVGTVADHLEADYGLPRGLARTSARRLLQMWDDAGLFVAGGPYAVVTARTRLLLELGRAIRISTMDKGSKEARIRELLSNPAKKEIVQFVVAFDPEVSELVVHMATKEGDLPAALVLGTAFRRHPSRFADCLHALINTLIASVFDMRNQRFVSVALLLAHLPIPPQRQDTVRSAVQWRLPPVWAAIAEAIAAYEWGIRDSDQLTLDLPGVRTAGSLDPDDVAWRVAAFHRVMTVNEPPERGVEVSDLEWKIEPGFALLKAAEVLAAADFDLDIVEMARASPLVLNEHAMLHVDMLAADQARLPPGSAAAQSQQGLPTAFRRDAAALARVIDTLAESAAATPDSGDWSLDVFVDVLRIANLHQVMPGVIDDIVKQGLSSFVRLLRDIASVAGITQQELSSSAVSCAELLSVNTDNETVIDYQWDAVLYGNGAEWAKLDLPYSIDMSGDEGGHRQQALERIVSVALSDDPLALYVAGVVLQRLGSGSPAAVAGAVRSRLVGIDTGEFDEASAALSALICKLDPDAISEHRDSCAPGIRWGVLYSLTHRVACEGAAEWRSELESLACDPDLTVRDAILQHLEFHEEELVIDAEEVLNAALVRPAEYWSCIECGSTGQPVDSTTCRNCGEETRPILSEDNPFDRHN